MGMTVQQMCIDRPRKFGLRMKFQNDCKDNMALLISP